MGKKNQKAQRQEPIVKAPTQISKGTPKAEAASPSKDKKWYWIGLVLLGLVSFVLYSNTFSHRFVLDDHGIIKNNKITKAAVSWENTKTIFSTPLRKGDFSDLENSLYRPFVKLLFNIEWNVFDANTNSFEAAHSFHVVNVFLYALLCMLLFATLYDMFKKSWVLAFIATLLFAVHPMHAEVVANIKSGDEILSLMGIVIALRCMQLYFSKQKVYWLVLAVLGFLMGLYSKESTVVAVAIFPIFLYFYTPATLKQNITFSSIMLCCAVLFIISRHVALSGYPEPSPTSALDNYLVLTKGAERFSSAVNTLGFYIYTYFVPHPLSCDYSYSSLKPVPLSNPGFIVSFLLFAAGLMYAIYKFKQKNIMVFGILWFFITMSITSNVFFLIGTSFGERLFFAPSLGITLLVVGLLALLAKKAEAEKSSITQQFSNYKVAFGVVFIVSIIYSVKTYARNNDWRSDYELFARDIEHFPNSTHLLFYMGNHLSGTERKEVLTDIMSQLGFNQNQINDSVTKESRKSIDYFNRALSIYPALPPDGYNQLGKAYFNNNNLDSALKYYQLANSQDSTNGIFINNIGTIYYNRGIATMNQGNAAQNVELRNEGIRLLEQSFPFFKKAHIKDTTESDFMNNIGCVFGTLGAADSAIYWFERALAKDSMDLTSIQFLDITWRNKGNIQTADYYKAKADYVRQRKAELLRM